MVDLVTKPHSLTHIQNLSFDETNQLAVREIVGVDTNGVVRKVPVSTAGELITAGGLSVPAHDYISLAQASTTDTWVFKTGGSSGTTVATVVLTYTDANKTTISTVEKT